MTDTLTPVLSANWADERSWKITNYERRGGYQALRKALKMTPDEVINEVKDAGLRGRGGAGFPTGMKWSFVPQDNPNPKYLVVNADESEPGTCKDIPLMMANPHSLVEGVIISAYAIRSNFAFIYIRGEVLHVIRRLQQAVREAYSAGYLGKNILGTGHDLELVVHAGAGAYICGEETALLDSLEGRRGQPRLRPPFPAVAGLYASPTVVNNVESIAVAIILALLFRAFIAEAFVIPTGSMAPQTRTFLDGGQLRNDVLILGGLGGGGQDRVPLHLPDHRDDLDVGPQAVQRDAAVVLDFGELCADIAVLSVAVAVVFVVQKRFLAHEFSPLSFDKPPCAGRDR